MKFRGVKEYEQHIILLNCYNHYYSCFKIFRDSLGKMGYLGM